MPLEIGKTYVLLTADASFIVPDKEVFELSIGDVVVSLENGEFKHRDNIGVLSNNVTEQMLCEQDKFQEIQEVSN